MAVGFRVFNTVLLRIIDFIVEFYLRCQPLTAVHLKEEKNPRSLSSLEIKLKLPNHS